MGTGERIESGKWVSLEVTVTNKQVITREAEVRVKAPPPFRVEPKGVIKTCSSYETVFPFQITVDTLSEVTGTLEIELYYEGERIDITYVIVTGYPPRQQESSAWSSLLWSLPLFALILAITILLLYFVRAKKRQTPYLELPPPPPPPEPAYPCPTCGNPLTYVPQYRRWYCHHCRKYV
ncbi:MAG: hypothetical protein QXU11_09485 [Thermoproteota archaeon]